MSTRLTARYKRIKGVNKDPFPQITLEQINMNNIIYGHVYKGVVFGAAYNLIFFPIIGVRGVALKS